MKTRSRFIASIVATARAAQPPMPYSRACRRMVDTSRRDEPVLRRSA